MINDRTKRRTICKFASLKNKKTINVKTSLEKDFLYHLEFSSEVIAYEEYFHKVFYPENNKYLPFVFDFLIHYKEKKELAIIRPINNCSLPSLRKIAEACVSKGYEFKIYEEPQIRTQKLINLKLLYKYSRLKVSVNHQIALHKCFSNCSALLLEDVQKYFVCHNLAPEIIYTLLFQKILHTDLNEPLFSKSVIRVSAGIKEVV
jgi:hypothetical protein